MENQQEFKLITDWQDIQNRLDFLESLPVKNEDDVKDKLEKIIAPYQFTKKVTCSISQCSTKHNHGYLVKLKDNHTIIIGKDCGKKYFGAEFSTQQKLVNQTRIEQEYIALISEEFKNLTVKKNNYIELVNPSSKLGIHKILNQMKFLTEPNQFIDYWMIKELKNSKNFSGLGEIFKFELKTKEEIADEIELIKLTRGRGRNSDNNRVEVESYKKIVIGKVENFELVYKQHEIKDLIKYFESTHREIKDPLKMTSKDRKALVKKLRSYNHNLSELKSFIDLGNVLFSPSNILQLKQVFKSPSDADKLENWVKSFSEK